MKVVAMTTIFVRKPEGICQAIQKLTHTYVPILLEIRIKIDARAIFLLGDLFDFWFEYSTVVPKGFIRVLGKLAALRDSGLPIYFFVGNHDLWMRDYFQEELNIPVFRDPKEFKLEALRQMETSDQSPSEIALSDEISCTSGTVPRTPAKKEHQKARV